MEYDYLKLLGKLSSNAAMWVAIIAILLLPVFEQDAVFLIIFVLIVLANFVLVLIMKNWAPEFFARLPFAEYYKSGPGQKKGANMQQNIGFRLAPLAYPKVHDEELRAFVPEYVRVEVVGNTGVLFSGNVPRAVLKQLRQAITDSLEARQSANPQQAAQSTAQPGAIAPAVAQSAQKTPQAAQAKALEKAKAPAIKKKQRKNRK